MGEKYFGSQHSLSSRSTNKYRIVVGGRLRTAKEKSVGIFKIKRITCIWNI